MGSRRSSGMHHPHGAGNARAWTPATRRRIPFHPPARWSCLENTRRSTRERIARHSFMPRVARSLWFGVRCQELRAPCQTDPARADRHFSFYSSDRPARLGRWAGAAVSTMPPVLRHLGGPSHTGGKPQHGTSGPPSSSVLCASPISKEVASTRGAGDMGILYQRFSSCQGTGAAGRDCFYGTHDARG
jgi:hypothetical protein